MITWRIAGKRYPQRTPTNIAKKIHKVKYRSRNESRFADDVPTVGHQHDGSRDLVLGNGTLDQAESRLEPRRRFLVGTPGARAVQRRRSGETVRAIT